MLILNYKDPCAGNSISIKSVFNFNFYRCKRWENLLTGRTDENGSFVTAPSLNSMKSLKLHGKYHKVICDQTFLWWAENVCRISFPTGIRKGEVGWGPQKDTSVPNLHSQFGDWVYLGAGHLPLVPCKLSMPVFMLQRLAPLWEYKCRTKKNKISCPQGIYNPKREACMCQFPCGYLFGTLSIQEAVEGIVMWEEYKNDTNMD